MNGPRRTSCVGLGAWSAGLKATRCIGEWCGSGCVRGIVLYVRKYLFSIVSLCAFLKKTLFVNLLLCLFEG